MPDDSVAVEFLGGPLDGMMEPVTGAPAEWISCVIEVGVVARKLSFWRRLWPDVLGREECAITPIRAAIYRRDRRRGNRISYFHHSYAVFDSAKLNTLETSYDRRDIVPSARIVRLDQQPLHRSGSIG